MSEERQDFNFVQDEIRFAVNHIRDEVASLRGVCVHSRIKFLVFGLQDPKPAISYENYLEPQVMLAATRQDEIVSQSVIR